MNRNKKRGNTFSIMGTVALIVFLLINRPDTPMTLSLSLGTMIVFLYAMAIANYFKK